MKILVMQLLRLGDLISLAPVIEGVKQKYPGAAIDLMVNKEAMKAAPLFSGVRKIVEVDRTALQVGLGEAERSFFESYDRLHQIVLETNRENYDLIINFTQNRFSARLLGIFEAKKKIGLTIQGDQIQFGSSWFEYLNSPESALIGRFHYNDVFRYAANLGPCLEGSGLTETVNGQRETMNIVPEGEKFIAIQPYTSDAKKDWPENKFIRLIQLLAIFYPSHKICILGAPFEKDRVENLIEKCGSSSGAIIAGITSIEGAFSLLKRATALVTGDTSIKHLAVATETPILEISLGSSDARTTGPYCSRAVVIQSKAKCAPCSHSAACSQERHLCSDKVSPELVAMSLQALCHRDQRALEKIAQEYLSEASVFTTKFSDRGDWLMENAIGRQRSNQIAELIAKIGWKGLLQEESERFAEIGSECFAVQDSIEAVSDIKERLARNLYISENLHQLKAKIGRVLVRSGENYDWESFSSSVKSFSDQLKDEEELYRAPLIGLINSGAKDGFTNVKKCRDQIEQMIVRGEIERKALRYFEENLGG